MSFKNIKGQDRAITLLKKSIQKGRVASSYLFSGPAGVGKAQTALQFAKALNCLSLANFDCCDRCDSCRKIDASNYPDLIQIEPEPSGRIKIKQVRRVQTELSIKPTEGKVKACIIREAEYMTAEASNALLKTLEEPPIGYVLILTTSNCKALFPTIVSRSQVVRFFPLDTETVKEILQKESNLTQKEASFLARSCPGSPGEAVALKDKSLQGERDNIVNGLLAEDLTLAEKLKQGLNNRTDAQDRLEILCNCFRDLLLLKADTNSFIINSDRQEQLLKLSKRFSLEGIQKILEDTLKALRAIRQNANMKLTMDWLSSEIENLKWRSQWNQKRKESIR